jgi:hypothetical protein
VTITRTPADAEVIREYRTDRKVNLKGKAFALTEISEVEALRIREYCGNDYLRRVNGTDLDMDNEQIC